MSFKVGNYVAMVLALLVAIYAQVKTTQLENKYRTQNPCCTFSVEAKKAGQTYEKLVVVPNYTYTPEYFHIMELKYIMLMLLFSAIPAGGIMPELKETLKALQTKGEWDENV